MSAELDLQQRQDIVERFEEWLDNGPHRSNLTFSRNNDGQIHCRLEVNGRPQDVLSSAQLRAEK